MWVEGGDRCKDCLLERAARWTSTPPSLSWPLQPTFPALVVTFCQLNQSQGKGCFHDNTACPGHHLFSFSPLSNSEWERTAPGSLAPKRELGDVRCGVGKERGGTQTQSEGAACASDILILPCRRHSQSVPGSCPVPGGLHLKAAIETLSAPSSTQMPAAMGDKNVTFIYLVSS